MSEPLEQVTGDDSVYCRACGKETSLAMIGRHLKDEHGIDWEDITSAPVVDLTGEDDASAQHECQRCGSTEWTSIDYGGCSVCRPKSERESEDDGDPR